MLRRTFTLDATADRIREAFNLFNISATGVANVCIEWLNNQNSYTKNEIIEYLEKLIPDNIGE
ncbi:MAG: hypothetical protein II833_07630 [Pseudobutyrivibrio sp.]|nr:hypothetical protein [Pseudobutyrivibrio sp.]